MENKNNKTIMGVLVGIIIILLCLVCYVLFGEEIFKDNASNTPKVSDNSQNSTTKTTDELYNEYLTNLKKEITDNYKTYSNNVVSANSVYLNTDYNFTIDKNLNLTFTTNDGKYTNYKVSENVLNMFLIEIGNAGYRNLYFIKADGSLNKMCIDCLKEDNTVKVLKEDRKNIINVTQGLFEYQNSGASGPIFIDITGNIETE